MDPMKLLKGLMGNKSLASGLGGKLLGSIFGGGGGQTANAAPTSGGGIGGMLGGLLGGGGSEGGGIGGMLGGLLGGGKTDAASAVTAHAAPQVDENQQAILMIRAMINAAKSDGRVDQQEQENIIQKLGDISPEEADFLRTEFAAPLDASGFANSIPTGMEQQIYALSLTSIELDSQSEAKYLHSLAQGLNLSPEVCNQIHDQAGAPEIYS